MGHDAYLNAALHDRVPTRQADVLLREAALVFRRGVRVISARREDLEYVSA